MAIPRQHKPVQQRLMNVDEHRQVLTIERNDSSFVTVCFCGNLLGGQQILADGMECHFVTKFEIHDV